MNDLKSVLNCPSCGGKSHYLLDWEYSGLNDSIFNYTARLFECPNCGFVYNSDLTDEKLATFYANECSYFEKSHFNIEAPENIKKFECYTGILSVMGLSDTPITDIGCGRGGFLIWLKNKGWKERCRGVDIDVKSIPGRNATAGGSRAEIDFQEGRAVALPFADESESLLTYFHVFEHIVDLNKVLREAFRVLKARGYVMIEVPDGERYKDYPIGTAFWLSIREHVYHFSSNAICNALVRNGFDMVSINRNMLPTPEFSYPSLIVVARKGDSGKNPEKCKNRDIASFVIQSKEKLRIQSQRVLEFISQFPGKTFWGCSAELFSLLPAMNLRDFNLCDSSKIKQKCSYKGIPIDDPKTIKKNGALIIAPYLFGDEIERDATNLCWPKENIFRLR